MSKYHVALSFAGEDRDYVEKVAKILEAEGVEVFYDRFEEDVLWGKDLYSYLTDVYRNQAMFTVMFVSEAYGLKRWTNHERKSAQARAFSESREYILPAFFDDTIQVPGLLETTGHVSLKNKSPEVFAALIVKKLRASGVMLPQRIAYSDGAKADVDFKLWNSDSVSEIILSLRTYTWGRQNPAVARLLELDWSTIKPDEAFVLGRNLYQTACGGERKAAATLTNLRRTLAAIPDERALDLLNGMFFEVYFNSTGEFRGRDLKGRCLGDLLKLQTVSKYASSIAFIRRALEPYKSGVLFMPNASPERVVVNVVIKKSDPPTVQSIKVRGKQILKADSPQSDLSARLWRLSYESFSVESLRGRLASDWHIPEDQLDVTCTPTFDSKVKFRLPEAHSLFSPLAQ